MGKTGSACGVWQGELSERGHLEDLGEDVNVILISIL
jgi:hypothetical protein